MNMHKEKTQNKRGEKSTEEETFKFVCLFERESFVLSSVATDGERVSLWRRRRRSTKNKRRRRRYHRDGCRREREGERRNGDI